MELERLVFSSFPGVDEDDIVYERGRESKVIYIKDEGLYIRERG